MNFAMETISKEWKKTLQVALFTCAKQDLIILLTICEMTARPTALNTGLSSWDEYKIYARDLIINSLREVYTEGGPFFFQERHGREQQSTLEWKTCINTLKTALGDEIR